MLGKNDIADFRIDYKKDDWIRAIINLENEDSIVIHWDYVSQHLTNTTENSGNPSNDRHIIEESWTHTANRDFSRSEKETILNFITASKEYEKLTRIWPFAAEIIIWKSKHPDNTLPPPDQYIGFY